MEPTKELIAELDRQEIERAREMTFAQKFLAGAELFDYACAISRGGIKMDHPDFDERQITEELKRRIHVGERLWEGL